MLTLRRHSLWTAPEVSKKDVCVTVFFGNPLFKNSKKNHGEFMGNTPFPWSSCMEEADDRGGPGILTDCLAGLADTTIWADRGPIDQNPSKIEPQQDEKDARRANAAPPCRSCHEVECFGFKAISEWEQKYLEIAFKSNPFGFPVANF